MKPNLINVSSKLSNPKDGTKKEINNNLEPKKLASDKNNQKNGNVKSININITNINNNIQNVNSIQQNEPTIQHKEEEKEQSFQSLNKNSQEFTIKDVKDADRKSANHTINSQSYQRNNSNEKIKKIVNERLNEDEKQCSESDDDSEDNKK